MIPKCIQWYLSVYKYFYLCVQEQQCLATISMRKAIFVYKISMMWTSSDAVLRFVQKLAAAKFSGITSQRKKYSQISSFCRNISFETSLLRRLAITTSGQRERSKFHWPKASPNKISQCMLAKCVVSSNGDGWMVVLNKFTIFGQHTVRSIHLGEMQFAKHKL